MKPIIYYQYLGRGKIRPVDIDTVQNFTNPRAICTLDNHMVINTFNSSFSLEELKEVIEFIQTKIEQDEDKPSN